jgi:hypothetical protein
MDLQQLRLADGSISTPRGYIMVTVANRDETIIRHPFWLLENLPMPLIFGVAFFRARRCLGSPAILYSEESVTVPPRTALWINAVADNVTQHDIPLSGHAQCPPDFEDAWHFGYANLWDESTMGVNPYWLDDNHPPQQKRN